MCSYLSLLVCLFQITNLTQSFSNLSVTEQINETDILIGALVMITQPEEQSQYPQELSVVVGIISTINKLVVCKFICK